MSPPRPHLIPNPALRESPALPRLIVGGPAAGQVRSSPTGWKLNAIRSIERTVTQYAPGITDELHRWDTVTYYAEEVAFAGQSWRTWRLAEMDENEHIIAAVHALVQTVHELAVRVPLLQSGQDAVDSTT